MSNLVALVPIIAFLLLSAGAALVVHHRHGSQGGFVNEYFIGSRSLGGFVLAMTTIATYGSVSSFVGGPGQAWSVGWGWVYMACIQATALFLLYGIMGRKLALVSRRVNAVTIIDIIRARYKSEVLACASAAVIVLFFATTMVAQFVGGAKLFEAVTGYSYIIGLALFGIAVIFYTTVGGFRGVAITDALCGIAMIVGIVILAAGILSVGGGYEQLMQNIAQSDPDMLQPVNDEMPLGLYLTQWLLVGILTFCLPQSLVRCMGFKDMKSLKRALVVGTVIIGFVMISVTALGVLSRGILTEDLSAYGTVDDIIPTAIRTALPTWLAGIAIVGPIAASISTVSSLLISSSSAIVKDLVMHYRERAGKPTEDTSASHMSQAVTLAVGVLVFVLSVVPPDVIWKVNMFAFGGLETAFCWVIVGGLFWKRANACGAVLSMVGGTLAYCVCMGLGFTLSGLHQIVIGISVSLVLMVLGSLLGKKQEPDELFFPA